VLERPAAMVRSAPRAWRDVRQPCIAGGRNAIFNAVGVCIDDLPITPEKVLRAIKAQAARDRRRR
jgi:hypothetical protein